MRFGNVDFMLGNDSNIWAGRSSNSCNVWNEYSKHSDGGSG